MALTLVLSSSIKWRGTHNLLVLESQSRPQLHVSVAESLSSTRSDYKGLLLSRHLQEVGMMLPWLYGGWGLRCPWVCLTLWWQVPFGLIWSLDPRVRFNEGQLGTASLQGIVWAHVANGVGTVLLLSNLCILRLLPSDLSLNRSPCPFCLSPRHLGEDSWESLGLQGDQTSQS